jgi:type VI secretion system protein ImpA
MRLTAEELMQPISEDLPCGEDLEYDPVFQQMESMMQSKPEQEFGDTVIPGEGPDWAGVSQQVDELLPRTRDLRVLTYAALADLHLTGLSAFTDSLESLNSCLETYWEKIYPELDTDDNNDATMRFNVLQILNDHGLVCSGLENAPLVELKGVGVFSLRDIELAEGKTSPVGEEEVQDIALIQGAFGDANPEALAALGEGVGGSMAQLNRMAELWDQLATDSPALDVDRTLGVLKLIHQAISKYAPVAAAAVEGADAGKQGADNQADSAVAAPVGGGVNNRNDVVNAIDKICDYYSAHEPSSPVPLLLRRAQRLVAKSFSEILEDIAPDGVTQLKTISGANADSSE